MDTDSSSNTGSGTEDSASALNSNTRTELLLSDTPLCQQPSASGEFPFSCGSFSIAEGGATVTAFLTADDSGYLRITDSGGQEVLRVEAVLDDWHQTKNAAHWQATQSAFLPEGDYTAEGSVTNDDISDPSENLLYCRYQIIAEYVVSQDEDDEDDDIDEEPPVCPDCGCGDQNGGQNENPSDNTPASGEEDCGGSVSVESSGGGNVVAPAMARGAARAAASTSAATALRYRSVWMWRAEQQGSKLIIRPASGRRMRFDIRPGESAALPAGMTRHHAVRVQLQNADLTPCTNGSPAYWMLAEASGRRVRFETAGGTVAAVISPTDKVTTAAQHTANVQEHFDADGNMISCYSPTQGLMLRSTDERGAAVLSWYAPDAVTRDAAGNYHTTGEPYKTSVHYTSLNGGVELTSVRRQQRGLPPHTVTRVVFGNTVTLIRGSSSSGVVRTWETTRPAPGTMQCVESVRRYSELTGPASCICRIRKLTAGGWVTVSETEGYGSPLARTTTYEYNDAARVSKVTRPDGGYTEYTYDADGRVSTEISPWGQGGRQRLRYLYDADSARFFDNRPVKVYTDYQDASGRWLNIRVTDYRYESTAAAERTTTTTFAAGVSRQQVSIEEHYGEQPAYAYAAGKMKFRQAVNGVQTFYDYQAAAEHGAAHLLTVTTKANGALIAGQSRRTESYLAADDTVRFEQESIWDGSAWLPLESTAYEYDEQQRVTRTTHSNGRSSATEHMCCGILSSTDEDGIRTDRAYDPSMQLTETTRAAVYDGDTCITPETITEFERDAAGRVRRTTRRIGSMTTTETTAYDALGRVISQTDALGRTTTTSYSEDGLTTTVTTPAGATLITTLNADGSTAFVGGTGQREVCYLYDLDGNNERVTTRLSDGSIVEQRSVDGFGQTVVQSQPNTLGGLICTRSEYNALGQVIQQVVDGQAPVVYAYDDMGNVCRQTVLLDAAAPEDATKNRIRTRSISVAQEADGVYQVVATARNNAAGAMLSSVQKTLISASATLESKTVSVDERGNTSATWTTYGTGSARTQYSSVPGTSNTAQSISVDGFTTSQVDHAGITSGAARRYTASGMVLTQTDGRGNETTSVTDIAGRAISVTDAAGNTLTTAYCTCCDNPALITDPLGHTTCYRYDVRGRKVAEWGTAIQPALFGYDDADRMTTLTTFREGTEPISTDPSDLTDGLPRQSSEGAADGLPRQSSEGAAAGDTTTWTYDDATGLETAKTYADGHGTAKTYDAYNRLATLTNARGTVQTNTYDALTGLLTGIEFSDDTTAQSFEYNILGQLTQVTDAAGTRTFAYNAYGEQTEDSVSVNGTAFPVVENYDSYGRSTGYSLKRNAADMQVVRYGYGTDGRLNAAGFVYGGQEKQFGYTYLPGSNLLQTLTMPNGMSLTQSYEAQRDLLIGMDYRRGNTLVAQRTYAYDAAARPTTRSISRQGSTRNDSFTHNDRSELTAATLGTDTYVYDYDNIGNRVAAVENSSGVASRTEYQSNNLNQYTAIDDFTPEYDLDGNQTRIKTSTGIWLATYNALNRPVRFESADGTTVITADYDYMGRRVDKRVERNGSTTSHLRFLYRNYLQIAALDLTRPTLNAMWFITWDPTQPVATRPLAIQKDGTWYTYGWDLTKNICELYTGDGYIATAYTYTPYGSVTSNGYADQPLQWSSEYNDTELGLVYYNYRHYNPVDGRWKGRDLLPTLNPCVYSANTPVLFLDVLGAWKDGTSAGDNSTEWLGHSDLGNLSEFDYAKEDHGATSPYRQPNLHFMDLKEIEPPLLQSVKSCNKNSFESNMHRMQDFFAHFSQGHRWPETIGHFFFMEFPDDPTLHAKQFELARKRTELWEDMWMSCCCLKNGNWEQNIANSKQCQELTVPPNDYTIIHSYSELEEARKNAEQEGAKKVFEALFRLMKKMVETSTKRSAKQIGGAASTSPANLKQIYLQR